MGKSLQDVSEVYDTDSIEEANRLLASGWVLLNTYTYAQFYGSPESLTLAYVLGKISSQQSES